MKNTFRILQQVLQFIEYYVKLQIDDDDDDDNNRGTLVVIMRILSLVREESGLARTIRLLWSAIY